MKRLRQFTKWMKGQSHLYLIGMAILFAMQYFRTLTPLFIQHVVDTTLAGRKSALPGVITRLLEAETVQRELLLVGIVFTGFALFRLTFVFLQRAIFAVFTERTAYKMRNRIYDHLQNLSFSYHSQAETGDLLQRATTDVETYRRFIGEQLVDVLRLLFLVVFAIVQMSLMSPRMTVISLAITPVVLTAAIVYFIYVKRIFRQVEEAESRMTSAVQENVTSNRVVKAFANEPFEMEKFDATSVDFRDESMRLTRLMAFFWSSTDLLIFGQYALTASFGIYSVVTGTLATGEFIAFLSLLGMIVWPLRQLGRIVGDFGKTQVALERIDEIMDEEDEHTHDEGETPAISGNIRFENVGFQFADDTKPLLKEISFTAAPGETLAVVGRTGSGKSTLMNLLVRLLEPTAGHILFDGKDIRSINKKHLRKHVGIILQEPFLYSKTVRENIAILNREADTEHIREAARTARLHEDIEDFEAGYDTVVGERGVTLSGGQKQRLAIARMLLERKPVLVFDDSLSAVDAETDIQIRKALMKHWRETTVFIITHRIQTAMEADRIIVLENGRITASGPHESLVRESGLYAELYKQQTETLRQDGSIIEEGGEDHAAF